MSSAIKRIVVRIAPQEKQTLAEKARQLSMSLSELMRRGAVQYMPPDPNVVALAKAAQASAERSMAAMDESLAAIVASNARIAVMESTANAERHCRAAAKRHQRTR
jgi:hypothetical protein